MQACAETNRDPFQTIQLPSAAIALKQGFGRLIRDREDFGVVALCDPRLRTRGYGALFLASMPPAPVVTESDEAAAFLRRRLARAGVAVPAALEA
jgi:ATP-dependent DNA helicase DinG